MFLTSNTWGESPSFIQFRNLSPNTRAYVEGIVYTHWDPDYRQADNLPNICIYTTIGLHIHS
jgi:hypothetical protein